MTDTARAPRGRVLLAGCLVLHLLPFAVRPAIIGGDEPHYALIAHSLATYFYLSLRDEYEDVESGSSAAGRKRRGERLERHVRTVGAAEVPSHPVGLPLLLAPIAALQQGLAPGSPPDIVFGLVALLVTFVALLAGARLLATRAGSPRAGALLLFGIYFASPLWFYSRTLFTEPFTWSFGVLGVASIAAGSFGLASVFLGLALAMKETALLLVAPIIAAAAIHSGWKKGAVLAIGPLAWAAAFVAKNMLTVGTPLSTFQTFQMGDAAAGAAGLIADPARGLLWFAPLLLLSIAGWLVPASDRADRIAGWASAAIVLGYFVVTAAWVDWRGGSSYGPRLLIPALPALAVPLARLWLARTGTRWRAAFAAAALAGFVVNWCAALDPFTAFWGPAAWELVAKNGGAAGGGVVVGAGILYWLTPKNSS